MPEPGFVDGLGERLRAQAQQALGRGDRLSRRGLLRAGGLAAAAAATGVVADRLVGERAPAPGREDLAASGARWQAVAAAASVPAGGALRFTTGALQGVLVNRGVHAPGMHPAARLGGWAPALPLRPGVLRPRR
jgi:hypothetical protein